MICISTLTLRSTENSKLLYDVGAPETIVTTMKLHPTSKIVQVFRTNVGDTKKPIKKLSKLQQQENLSLCSVTVLGLFEIWYPVRATNVQHFYRMVRKMC